MKKKSGQSFLEGALVLTTATLIVKAIGALFKIPLANILGGVGMSYFVAAYDIFTPIYSLTVTGLGVAVSRLVSETIAAQGPRGLAPLLRSSRRLFLALGLGGMALLLLFAKGFAGLIGNQRSVYAIYAIAPAIVFSCISAAYRGYYQGMADMLPTAKSQVVEAVVKLLVGTALSYGVTLFLRGRYLATGLVLGEAFRTLDQANLCIYQYSAAAAVLGITLSTAVGALYIRHRYLHDVAMGFGPNLTAPLSRPGKGSFGLTLLKIAIPISLSTLVVNLTAVIDLVSVMNCLRAAIGQNAQEIRLMYQGLIPMEVTNDILPEYLYGSYSGLAFSLFNLIPSITAALGISALPAVTRAYAGGSREALNRTVNSVLRISLLVALPGGLGLSVLSGPILRFLYPARLMEAAVIAPVLRVMGISAILVGVTTPVNSILQATGHEKVPLVVLTAGGVIKLLTNLTLVSRPELNIQGVPYGSLLCYSFIVLVSLVVLVKAVGVRLEFFWVFCKPLFCALLCAGSAYASYYLFFTGAANGFRVVFAVCCGGGIYALMLLLTGTLAKSDIEMLLRNENLIKTLEKLGLIS